MKKFALLFLLLVAPSFGASFFIKNTGSVPLHTWVYMDGIGWSAERVTSPGATTEVTGIPGTIPYARLGTTSDFDGYAALFYPSSVCSVATDTAGIIVPNMADLPFVPGVGAGLETFLQPWDSDPPPPSPDWAVSDEAKAWFYGVLFMSGVMIFRAGLRWFKRAGAERFD